LQPGIAAPNRCRQAVERKLLGSDRRAIQFGSRRELTKNNAVNILYTSAFRCVPMSQKKFPATGVCLKGPAQKMDLVDVPIQ